MKITATNFSASMFGFSILIPSLFFILTSFADQSGWKGLGYVYILLTIIFPVSLFLGLLSLIFSIVASSKSMISLIWGTPLFVFYILLACYFSVWFCMKQHFIKVDHQLHFWLGFFLTGVYLYWRWFKWALGHKHSRNLNNRFIGI